MVAFFIVLGVCLFLLLAWIFFLACRSTKRKDKCKCECQQSDVLKQNIDDLLRLSEQLKIIEQLQHEKVCKDKLMEEIHSMFFFKEFKNPDAILQDFIQKAKGFGGNADKEDEKIAEMYKAIVEREK